MVKLGNSWDEILKDEFRKDYYLKLREFLKEEYSTRTIYPDMHNIFNALKKASYEDVKVVILGQDPYHGEGQAHGLCFSVPEGVQFPPSLRNIFQEVKDETGAEIPESGNLTRWARQGVFLLNTCLTVRAHQAFSHSGRGWETFTDAVIKTLSEEREGLVFMLWGAPAGRKAALIDGSRHLILQSAHPSPLSAYRGFFGNHHFELCNRYLVQHGKEPIQW